MRYYTVLGIFRDRADVEQAIDHLRDDGFRVKDISLVMKNEVEGTDLASSTGAHVAGGAVTGATTGAVIGGIAGLLVGIGALTIPGLGAFLIGGPLAAALGLTGAAATTASGAVTGAVAGGLLGAIMGLGIPEEQARVYETQVQAGGILLAVPASENRVDDALDILEEFGASEVKSVLLSREHMYDFDEEEDSDDDYHRRYDQPSAHFAGAKGGRSRQHHRHLRD